jgi:methionine-gamma-lyase
VGICVYAAFPFGYGFDPYTDDNTVEKFCAALKVITFAVSLGHDESLVFPQPSYDERMYLYPDVFNPGFVRFSIGLENPQDIIDDLDQALKSVGL